MDPETIISAVKEHVSCSLGDDAVILHFPSNTYYGLNPVGAAVWDLIQQPRRFADICARVREQFAVDEDTCARDITELVQHMANLGLAEIQTSAGLAA